MPSPGRCWAPAGSRERSWPRDLLTLDDLGLHRLTGQQSADLYELIISQHRVSSLVITGNRAVGEWLSLFDDPILGDSALDGPAHQLQLPGRHRGVPATGKGCRHTGS